MVQNGCSFYRSRAVSVSFQIMILLHKRFIESVLIFRIIAWHGNLSLANKTMLGNLVREAGMISGRTQIQLVDFPNMQIRKVMQVLRKTL